MGLGYHVCWDPGFFMHRLALFSSTITLALLLPATVVAQDADTRQQPNVLFISIDDLNDWVGCLGGHPQARTPNIDRLASQAVLFTRAYCPAPACLPSRAATMTGLAPHRTGVYSNGQVWRQALPDAVTLPQHFMHQGYRAAGAGKIFHHYQNDPKSWHDFFPGPRMQFPTYAKPKDEERSKFPRWKHAPRRWLANARPGAGQGAD